MLDFQRQVLVGTVLGGSSLVKSAKSVNYHLSMRDKNMKWLEYKMAEMPDYFADSTIFYSGGTYRCNSISCSELTEFQKLMYSESRRLITMEILDKLMDIGIAVWFLDSGSKTGRNRKNAYINTTRFGNKAKVIEKYFNEIDMPCKLNKDSKRTKVLFTVDGTLSLLKTIAHRFPPFMYDKI